jgi:hypothetical protein
MSMHEEMAAKLKTYGPNHGFAPLGTGVVVVGPGSPFSVYPTSYAASELENAAEAGILERRRLGNSLALDIYAIK